MPAVTLADLNDQDVPLLNHTYPRTTKKHYNKGASVMAAQVYQGILLKCGA
jgi:hypothetical protein